MQRAIERAPHLRLVPPCPPRRIEVRSSAYDRHAPFGRSRMLKLTEPDLARLIETAIELERAP